MAKMNEDIPEEKKPCPSCGDHGYRVEIAPGRTVNAAAALHFGYTTGYNRIPCHCQAAPEPLIQVPLVISVTLPASGQKPKPQRGPNGRFLPRGQIASTAAEVQAVSS